MREQRLPSCASTYFHVYVWFVSVPGELVEAGAKTGEEEGTFTLSRRTIFSDYLEDDAGGAGAVTIGQFSSARLSV